MRRLIATFLFPTLLCASPIRFDHKLDATKGPFTDRLIAILNQWPLPDLKKMQISEDKIHLRCINTGNAPKSIGLEQTMLIKSPLQNVAKVVDDIDHYKSIFPGFEEIKVVERKDNLLTTYWEQYIPLFANTKYELFYILDKKNPDRFIYRYQLKNSNRLTSSDGIIVLEKHGENKTRFTEIDFFEANVGVVKFISDERFWKETIEGIYVSDAALKIEAENPSLSHDDIRDQAKQHYASVTTPDRASCIDFYPLPK